MSPIDLTAAGGWTALAERLLRQALGELQDDEDKALATVSAASAALRAGEIPAGERRSLWDELAGILDDPGSLACEDERACTCPPGLVARGGFRSGCPAHGRPGPQATP